MMNVRRGANRERLINSFPVKFQGIDCTLIELRDEENGFKVVDRADFVLLWSCE